VLIPSRALWVGNSRSRAIEERVHTAFIVALQRRGIDVLDLPFGCLPDAFTLGELQSFCEHMLGHPLDKSSFRRRLSDRDLLVPVDGEFRVGAFRPAQLFRGATVGR
jgi:hypothetical protein